MKIANIVGARPQFIKLSPILRAINDYNRRNPEDCIEDILIHTGQHYDYEMSQVFFEKLGLKGPDYHLGVGSGSHAYQTGEMLKLIEEVLVKEKPDLVMVYGDTNTTLAGALAAAKLHILLAHVEAGLRSFNRRMPEEINRVLTDHVTDLLFCPTETAVQNLKQEGFTNIVNNGQLLPVDGSMHIPEGNSHCRPLVLNVGDVMYDAVLQYTELAERRSNILNRLNLEPKAYALATAHRVAQEGLTVVVPLHPRTRKILAFLAFESSSNLFIIEPISYLDMLMLEKNARVILTDSGGVQKEAFFFRVPCVTLREETEWVETVETGWNVLVGCNPEGIYRAALEAWPGVESVWSYGDGRAAERIVQWLKI